MPADCAHPFPAGRWRETFTSTVADLTLSMPRRPYASGGADERTWY